MIDLNALFASFFGAVGGACAAAFLAWSHERRQKLSDEILACNTAIGQCLAVANTFVAVKRQTVGLVCNLYAAECARFFFVYASAQQGVNVFPVFDSRETGSPFTAIEALNWTISHRIHSSYKPSMLAPSLELAIANQRDAVTRRNELIHLQRQMQPQDRLDHYFGLVQANGTIDTHYPDAMQRLFEYTDNCIYFSMLLADVLNEVGNQLVEKMECDAPKVIRPDFSGASDVRPDPARYKAFEEQFRPKRVDMIVTM